MVRIQIWEPYSYGVIGNTAVFGTAILGSNPGRNAIDKQVQVRYYLYMNEVWEDGLRTGASTIIDAIVSMLERELYKNKGEDVVYEYAVRAVIKKIKDMKID